MAPPFDPGALEAAASYSSTLTAWALLIVGGSIVMLLQTYYRRPQSALARRAYFALPLGWAAMVASIYFGTRAHQVHLAALFSGDPRWTELRRAIAKDIQWQAWLLQAGLTIFGIWLVLYLLWWIRHEESPAEESE